MKYQVCHVEDVAVLNRQREKIGEKELRDLKRSISANGLIHAIFVRDLTPEEQNDHPTKKVALVAGGRRLQAVTELFSENHNLVYGSELLPLGMIPYVNAGDLTEREAQEIELEENITRVDITWQERVSALARIHELRVEKNPAQTKLDTATELAPTLNQTPEKAAQMIARAKVLQENKDLPEIQNAKSENEAWRIISNRAKNVIAAEIARRERPDVGHKLFIGKFEQNAGKMEEKFFDLIIADPPYGLGAHEWSKGADSTAYRSISSHEYDDTKEYALEFSKNIFRECWHLAKDRANLFMFTGSHLFEELKTYAQQQGWSVWKRPIIWWKGNAGIAPWGHKGFRYTYEIFLYATKGQQGLIGTLPDVIHLAQIDTLDHGASKPVELYEKLINATCYKGSTILDPCCGAGTVFQAANRTETIAFGCELSEKFKNICELKMRKDYANSNLAGPDDNV